MKNLREVSERLKKAAKNKERIILYGDADLDGVTSAIILEESIEKIGGDVCVYISDRKKWGYGLSREAVSSIKDETPAILISLDCGISNFEGAEEAKKLGFELIIVDHHKALSNLPEASLILDPTQEGDDYPFKKLANVGIVYKLAEEILKEDFFKVKDRFLELTTIGTIADMVPREKDNKKILEEGLPLLEKPSIPGLEVLREMFPENFLEKIIPILNITKPNGKTNNTYLFFKENDKENAEQMIEGLKEDYKKRKEQILFEEERIISRAGEEEVVVFEEGSFPPYLAGSLASRVIRKCKKPTFLYTREGDVVTGSVRMTPGKDAVDAMGYCKEYLDSYGGHPEAAGFMLKSENVENFKKCLVKYFQKK